MPKTNFKTKSQVIYEKLKLDIVNGRYKPHQRIILSDVAKRYDSSESPVREAIRQLEAEGLVVNTPYVGAVVTAISLKDLIKLYEIRKILEAKAAKLAVKNIKIKDLEVLESIIKMLEKTFEEKKYESVHSLYKKYYKTLYAAGDNEYLYKIIFDLWDLSFRAPSTGILSEYRARTQQSKQSIQGLKKIVRALKKRDSDLVEKLIIKQKENALTGWKNIYRS